MQIHDQQSVGNSATWSFTLALGATASFYA
jgi:hypothetical protein